MIVVVVVVVVVVAAVVVVVGVVVIVFGRTPYRHRGDVSLTGFVGETLCWRDCPPRLTCIAIDLPFHDLLVIPVPHRVRQ